MLGLIVLRLKAHRISTITSQPNRMVLFQASLISKTFNAKNSPQMLACPAHHIAKNKQYTKANPSGSATTMSSYYSRIRRSGAQEGDVSSPYILLADSETSQIPHGFRNTRPGPRTFQTFLRCAFSSRTFCSPVLSRVAVRPAFRTPLRERSSLDRERKPTP